MVALLIISVSSLSGVYPTQQTFAQTNESVRILITDAIEDLQNNDTSTALTHSHLASQELSSQGVSSSDSALVLIHDAIQDLLNNDTDTAFTHLSLLNQQLDLPSEGVTSSAVSLNKTPTSNATLIEKQKENTTTTVGKDQCTDNNLNGRCSLDQPKSAASLCTDINHDLYCDWFKPVNIHPNGTITVNATASPPPVEINLCIDNDYDGNCDRIEIKSVTTVDNKCPDNNHDNVCEWYLATNGVWYPQGDGPTNTVVVNTTANNGTIIPPSVTPEDVCYNDGFDDGIMHIFRTVRDSSEACSKYGDYFHGFIVGCMDTGMLEYECEGIANATSFSAQPQPQPRVGIHPCPDPGFNGHCEWFANGTILWHEDYISPVTGSEEFSCQSNDDFCTPGCEYEDMQCIDPSKGDTSDSDFEYCEDFDGDGFCDITHLSDGTTMIEDQEEIERLKEGNDGMPETQQRQQRPSGSISVPVQPSKIVLIGERFVGTQLSIRLFQNRVKP